MKETINKLQALKATERRALFSALLLLPSIALLLRIRGYKRTLAFLQSKKSDNPDTYNNPEADLETARSITRMVIIAARYGPYRANCLKRSITSWWLLKKAGIAAQLVIGTNNDETEFKAHAWIELHGERLGESSEFTKRYTAFK